jgi:hypothetical protein
MAFRTVFAATSVLLLCGAATWYLLGRSGEPAAAPGGPAPPSASPATSQPPDAPPLVGEGPLPPPASQDSAEPATGYVLLPDGSYLPALNGVKATTKWGSGPFPGIKARFRHTDGNEWYLLNDGRKMTTVYDVGTIRGVTERRALLLCGTETAALPVKTMPLENEAGPGR